MTRVNEITKLLEEINNWIAKIKLGKGSKINGKDFILDIEDIGFSVNLFIGSRMKVSYFEKDKFYFICDVDAFGNWNILRNLLNDVKTTLIDKYYLIKEGKK